MTPARSRVRCCLRPGSFAAIPALGDPERRRQDGQRWEDSRRIGPQAGIQHQGVETGIDDYKDKHEDEFEDEAGHGLVQLARAADPILLWTPLSLCRAVARSRGRSVRHWRQFTLTLQTRRRPLQTMRARIDLLEYYFSFDFDYHQLVKLVLLTKKAVDQVLAAEALQELMRLLLVVARRLVTARAQQDSENHSVSVAGKVLKEFGGLHALRIGDLQKLAELKTTDAGSKKRTLLLFLIEAWSLTRRDAGIDVISRELALQVHAIATLD